MKSKDCSLNIGMKLEIEVSKNNEETTYPSQLLDIKNCEEFLISGPIVKNNLILLHKGEKINISYNVKDKGKHYFSAEIISRNHTKIYTLQTKKISSIKNIQQRKYYRLLTNIKVLKYFKDIDSKTEYNIEKCETKDISGGGMQIYSSKSHEIGDKVACSIEGLEENVLVKGKVVRIDEVDSFNYKYLIGISFIDIEDKYRDIIIKYIFDEQRKLRLKGLI
jgi:c-di-GMP-binding flagellar brake protein YcgR